VNSERVHAAGYRHIGLTTRRQERRAVDNDNHLMNAIN
jgi:hypothetical protein